MNKFTFVVLISFASILSIGDPAMAQIAKTPAPPAGVAGTAGGGGGNSLNGVAVDDYLVPDPTQDPRFPAYSKITDKFINWADGILPTFAARLKWARSENSYYVVVPTQIRLSPQWKTGLPFSAEQVCKHVGQEIFCDATRFHQAVTVSAMSAQAQYLQELIEAAFLNPQKQEDQNTAAARNLYEYFVTHSSASNTPSPEDLQAKIEQLEGETFWTPDNQKTWAAYNQVGQKIITAFAQDLDKSCKATLPGLPRGIYESTYRNGYQDDTVVETLFPTPFHGLGSSDGSRHDMFLHYAQQLNLTDYVGIDEISKQFDQYVLSLEAIWKSYEDMHDGDQAVCLSVSKYLAQ